MSGCLFFGVGALCVFVSLFAWLLSIGSAAFRVVMFFAGALLILAGWLISKAEAAEMRSKIEREQKEDEHRRERIGWLTFPVAGVTFSNDDGSSRQAVLREAYNAQAAEDDFEVNLERYDYNGELAIRVLIDDRCVGNVPRSHIDDVAEIMDRSDVDISIEHFIPEDGDGSRIYRADITLSGYKL